MDDTFRRRFLDALVTSVLSLLSISSFYGLWVLEDLILGDVGRETDDPVRGLNGGKSYVRKLDLWVLYESTMCHSRFKSKAMQIIIFLHDSFFGYISKTQYLK